MTAQTLPSHRATPPRRDPSRSAGDAPEASDASAIAGRSTIDDLVMERAARVIRVLGHPLRLRMLEVLEGGEHHVTDLVRASGVTQALVSQHLAILRTEGVVGARRDGLRVFYRITEPKVHRILACIRECDLPELATLGSDPELALIDSD
jgi:DNA-binding transcriptional ArsR family regulator